jgi:hypothetical protein
MELTAEEFFRNKLKELNPFQQVVTLSGELITAEQGMRWAHEFADTRHECLKYKTKAEKWDKLESKIGAFYEDEDSEGDLCDIGEIAAMEFGYL